MLYNIGTERGKIIITKNVIGKCVTEATKKYKGKVLISNYRGKIMSFVSRIGGTDDVDDMDITFTDTGIDIKVYVIIRFGTSIAMVTNGLIKTISENLKMTLGEEPKSISIIVKGVISKNIVKRNIEVKRDDEN